MSNADSESDEWVTPQWLAEALGRFHLDCCSNERSHIVSGYQCSLDRRGTMGDGLTAAWGCGSLVWCNPPYSNVLPWARKLRDHDGPWCALLKLDPSTKWWATLMEASPTVAPFRKRIKFERPDKAPLTANFPSVLVYSAWRPPVALRPHLWLPTWTQAEARP